MQYLTQKLFFFLNFYFPGYNVILKLTAFLKFPLGLDFLVVTQD